MNLYMIRRRSGWPSGAELEQVAARSREIADSEFPQDIRWIRSYVVPEPDGTLGTFCVYQATSDEMIRKHAERVGMPADEITAIADTVVIRPDPEPAAASA
jgi:sporulation protein YlmC with PRC-barrel domain